MWRMVGSAIFSRIASCTVFIVSQAFAGHLGDLQLVALSIAVNVIVEFDLGLMVSNFQAFVHHLNLPLSIFFLC